MSRNDSAPSPAHCKKRRKLLPLAIASTVVSALGFEALRRDYQATWGKLESPRFTIHDSPSLHDAPPTYYDRSAQQQLDSPREWLQSRLPQISKDQRSAFLREVVAHPQHSIDLDAHLREQYGSPLECAKILFRRATGEELPDSARILVIADKHWPSSRYSGSNHLAAFGVSLVQEQSFLDTLMTIVHELGHQVCPVGESLVFELSGAELALAREEACAYCFEYSCILHLDDPFMRDVLAGYFAEQRDRLVRRYQSGADDEHSKGMALFDVALSLYPPDQARQLLASGVQLDARIKERFSQLRSMPVVAAEPCAP